MKCFENLIMAILKTTLLFHTHTHTHTHIYISYGSDLILKIPMVPEMLFSNWLLLIIQTFLNMSVLDVLR